MTPYTIDVHMEILHQGNGFSVVSSIKIMYQTIPLLRLMPNAIVLATDRGKEWVS